MKHLTTTLARLSLAAIVAASPRLNADDMPDWKLFDKDGDNRLSRGQAGVLGEADIYALHTLPKDDRWRKWDKNRDGLIDAVELDQAVNELGEVIKKTNADTGQIIDQQRQLATNNAPAFGIDLAKPVTPQQQDDLLLIDRPRPGYIPGWFKLRGKMADFSKPANNGKLEQIGPAILSWGRDFVADGDTWSARGAIGGIWEASRVDLGLGAEFDRTQTGVTGKKDTDTLIFKAMVSGEPDIGSRKGILKSLSIRGGVDYGTSFDFEGGLLGASLEFEPVWSLKAFQSVQSLFGYGGGWSARNAPSIRLNNYLRVEGGGPVADFPGNTVANENYLRAGPQAQLTLWPFGTARPVSLTAAYGYYAAVQGKDYRNFRGGIDWRLDQDGHYTLRLEYVKGLTPLLLEEQENVLLSFGARF